MQLDALEYEIKTEFPKASIDFASFVGFLYLDTKNSSLSLYNETLYGLITKFRALGKLIYDNTEVLKKIAPLSGDGNEEAREPVVELYNQVYRMYKFFSDTRKKIQSLASIEPELDEELKRLIQLSNNQRKVLLSIIEGELRTALNEQSQNSLIEKMGNRA